MTWARLPTPPWRRYSARELPADLGAAVTVLFLAVPQGLAYATIAGLPPAVGLYAAAIPAIVASLFRSSSHVIAGPTNALSLLVGTAVAAHAGVDPVVVALTLTLVVGVMQAGAGMLRLGALVDFISSAVVLGYITGAAVLIGIGQLHNATATTGPGGNPWKTIAGWWSALPNADLLAVAVTLGTIALVIGTRWFNGRARRRIPSAIAVIVVGIAVNLAFGLEARGLRVVSDLAPIPRGLPPLTLPDFGLAPELITVALAVAVLSLVESSSVARSLAAQTGQRLDASTEFFGQGLANLSAAFFGGYPISGSLSRSALNERAGARTRVAGMIAGALMIVVLLAFGPILDHTPIATLAGLMAIVVYDLIDVARIRVVARTSTTDALAFAFTMVGTWVLSLDQAIYLGVGISVVLFLRKARMIRVVELICDRDGTLQERPEGPREGDRRYPGIRILHVEGALFFGAAGELRDALSDALREPDVQVLLLRLKRSRGIDATTIGVLVEIAAQLRARGGHLVIAGIGPGDNELFERYGAHELIGRENIFPTQDTWFVALTAGVRRALELTGASNGDSPPERITA